MPTATYSKTGTKAQTAVKLNPEIFGIKEINQPLIRQAYDAYLANGRVNLAVTKKRGDVRGGGRKPWAQKGTGRARVGSRRSPLWRGGGIIFGPTGSENYSKKLGTSAKRSALRQALSMANSEGRIKVIEELPLKTAKTAEINKLLTKIDISGYTLLVTDNINDDLKRATANLPQTKLIQANYLNIARLVDADTIVFTKAALASIDSWLTKEDKQAKGTKL